MDGYDNPFGMSDDDFLYYAMNEEDPMYMGGPIFFEEYYEDDYIDDEDDEYDDEDDEYDDEDDDEDYEERVADWYDAQLDKIMDAFDNYMADSADDPRFYFDGIEYNPYQER